MSKLSDRFSVGQRVSVDISDLVPGMGSHDADGQVVEVIEDPPSLKVRIRLRRIGRGFVTEDHTRTPDKVTPCD